MKENYQKINIKIKIRFYLIIFFFSISMFNCRSKEDKLESKHIVLNNHTLQNSEIKKDTINNNIQKKIYDTILNLPKIIKFLKEFKRDNIHRPSLLIISNPTNKEPYYWVQFGISAKEERLVPIYNFHVYVKGNVIEKVYYYDTLNEKEIPIDKWKEN